MSVLIKHMAIPKGCIYANDKDQTEYCPLLNHDDVPFCQYIENEPEIAIGIDERPVYCPLSDVPEPCEDAISRQATIDTVVAWTVEDRPDIEMPTDLIDRIKNMPSAQPDHIGDVNGMVSFTEKERLMLKKMRTLHNGTYADLLDRLVASAQPDLDSAYTEGYTQAEAKYRKMWDEMRDNIKEKAFGKRKGLVHTADIDAMPTIEPDTCEGCEWEFAFGYGECHMCSRHYEDCYERRTDETD